jgi:hypothetical protein
MIKTLMSDGYNYIVILDVMRLRNIHVFVTDIC